MLAPRLAMRMPVRPELFRPARVFRNQIRSIENKARQQLRPPQRSSQHTRTDGPSWLQEFVIKTTRYTLYTLPLVLTLLPWLPYSTVAVNGQSMTPLLSPAAHAQGTLGQDVLLVKPSSHLHLYADPVEEGGTGRGIEGVHRESGVKGLRGAIVVFRTPHAPNREGVKRVVGVEGDIIVVRHEFRHRWRTAVETGQLLGDVVGSGQSDDMPSGCAYPAGADRDSFEVKLRVPFGHIWVEGENAPHSRDSNDYGPISKSLIQGVAVGIVAPRERWNLDVNWEDDEWRERWRRRGFQWRDEAHTSSVAEGLDVPEEWKMHTAA